MGKYYALEKSGDDADLYIFGNITSYPWKEKDKDKKIQRWQKISEVAAKQCGRNKIPTISTIIKSNEIR